MKKEISDKLLEVQAKLKAPKSQFNAFAKFAYRSCEDILESVKPHLAEAGLTLTIKDSIEHIGDRFYLKATTLINGEEASTAFAREPEEKKGMDASQITGTASSYARKYALNALFLIDDTRDADTMDNSQSGKPAAKKPAPAKKAEPPKEAVDINKGVAVWDIWKTPKGTALGSIVSNPDIDTETKIGGLETILSNCEKLAGKAKDSDEATWRLRDVKFLQKAIEEVTMFAGPVPKADETEEQGQPF